MKQIIVVAIIVLCLVACTSSAEKKEKENLAVARKYMKAVETKNLSAIDSLLADNYMGYGPSIGDSINKEGAVLNMKYLMENLYESFDLYPAQRIGSNGYGRRCSGRLGAELGLSYHQVQRRKRTCVSLGKCCLQDRKRKNCS